MFSISGNRGFQITFENGYTVSVQFGKGNYCENYDIPTSYLVEEKTVPDSSYKYAVQEKTVPDCKNAETALIDGDNNFIRYLHDVVQKNMTPEMVLDLLNHARDLPQYVKKEYC